MTIYPLNILIRTTQSAFTLYMMMILFCWLAGWLQVDLHDRRLSWMRRITDPLVNRMRKLLPPMGPMDFGPIAAVFVVWLLRTISVEVLMRIALKS